MDEALTRAQELLSHWDDELGRTVAPGMFIGMIAAIVPSIVLFARHGSAARKMGLPFAPFLALGAVVALFAGHPILDAYLRLTGH